MDDLRGFFLFLLVLLAIYVLTRPRGRWRHPSPHHFEPPWRHRAWRQRRRGAQTATGDGEEAGDRPKRRPISFRR